MNDVASKVMAIIAEQGLLSPEDLSPENRLADLGIDSLALVESIFAIEEAFDVTVPFNANHPDAAQFDTTTVGSVIAAVEGLIARKAA
ncbi:MAG: acyl carrier protein [Paracoccaceae bacterium]